MPAVMRDNMRETVRSLSDAAAGNLRKAVLVREDRDGRSSRVPVVLPRALLVSDLRKR